MTNTVGNPAVNIAASAGWGRYNANISDFAGKIIQVTFHLESDTSINFGGFAIDDVQLRQIGPTAANVGVGGRVATKSGLGISRFIVSLTGSNGEVRTVRTNTFGNYRFDGIQAGQNYILSAVHRSYQFVPRVISVNDEITDADLVGIE